MMKRMMPTLLAIVALATGCGTSQSDYEAQTVQSMHDAVSGDLDTLVQAAKDLQAAAPTPSGRGWDATLDADAILKMKDQWVKARVAYEHVEGALAPIFPDLDASLDARYDDFLATTGPDADLFDDQGVTGLHAAERIIFSDVTPQNVIALEASLPGYKAAAFPATEAEAKEFHDKLLGRIIADAESLRDQWTPAKIDLAGAFTGLVDLMNEQREKVNKAGDQEEESRYSQRTMADLRANLEGTKHVYAAFQPWLVSLDSGAQTDAAIESAFDRLQATYDSIPGDAFPPPPDDWQAEDPSVADLMTPFGELYFAVQAAVDPNADGSVVFEMNKAGELMGLQ
jgi:iron uptake system component EfeO